MNASEFIEQITEEHGPQYAELMVLVSRSKNLLNFIAYATMPQAEKVEFGVACADVLSAYATSLHIAFGLDPSAGDDIAGHAEELLALTSQASALAEVAPAGHA